MNSYNKHFPNQAFSNILGLRLLRYGSLHATVLGLEVVLPTLDNTKTKNGSAQILDFMTPGMKKAQYIY